MNKVLLNCGLCVSFYDIIEAGDPVVHPAEGCCHQYIKFRLVVLRPFIGEVLTGKIVSSTEKGLQVSLGFFDDLYVPQSLLMSNSTYDQKNGLWIWMFSTDGIAETDFPMELGAIVSFRLMVLSGNIPLYLFSYRRFVSKSAVSNLLGPHQLQVSH